MLQVLPVYPSLQVHRPLLQEPCAPQLMLEHGSTIQDSVLHASEEEPLHVAPPPDGAGLVHARVRVPPPHEAEQAPYAVQPPSTVSTHATPVLLPGMVDVEAVHVPV